MPGRPEKDNTEQGGYEEYSSASMPTQRLTLPDNAEFPLPEGDDALRVAFKIFRSAHKRWPELFAEAANYATQVGRERLITISHSSDGGDGVVTVWFWADWTDDAHRR